MPPASPNEWIGRQVDKFAGLVGEVVVGYRGVEMAFIENGPGGLPVFGGEDAPFLQLDRLDVELASARTLRVRAYQNDDRFGLWLWEPSPSEGGTLQGPAPLVDADWDGIFRVARLDDLPTGPITKATAELDEEGEISVVTLSFGDVELALVAGEVFEQWAPDPPRVVFGDESVLVFTDQAVRRSLMAEARRSEFNSVTLAGC